MKIVGRIVLLAAAVLALSYFSALQSWAQLDEVEGLNKRIAELSQANKFSQAIPLAQRALSIRESALGPDHPDVATALNTLAELYVAQHRYAEAEPLYRRSLAIQEMALGPNHPNVAQARQQLLQLRLRETTLQRPQELREQQAAATPLPLPPAAASRSPKVGAAPPAPSLNMRSGGTRGGPIPPPSSGSSASSGTAPSALPDFPWPPPAASASYVLPRTIFASRSTVGQVVDAIVSALERTGYAERSFFRTQANGVALVTRIERINDDGTARAESDRWPAALQNPQSSSDLIGFFKGLFYVDRGRYRVIVFILQDLPFSQSTDRVAGPEARAWLREGANILPREVANRPFGDGNCSILIYEFASDGTAVRMVESRMTGRQHLEKAGVLTFLEKSN
jgi:tetratricopeptide (TPR) repeat protein